MVAKFGHTLLEQHQCESDAFGLFRGHRPSIEPAYGLPFHQLPKQLHEREYQLHKAALNCFRIGTHPGS